MKEIIICAALIMSGVQLGCASTLRSTGQLIVSGAETVQGVLNDTADKSDKLEGTGGGIVDAIFNLLGLGDEGEE